jgi:hypothetical protein
MNWSNTRDGAVVRIRMHRHKLSLIPKRNRDDPRNEESIYVTSFYSTTNKMDSWIIHSIAMGR